MMSSHFKLMLMWWCVCLSSLQALFKVAAISVVCAAVELVSAVDGSVAL